MTFTRETVVQAVRKQHRCDTCGNQIHAGSSAVRWCGMSDGEFHSSIMHPDCREAEIEFNNILGYQSGDDWMPLRDIESEDEIWLEQEFPTVFSRMFPGKVERVDPSNG